MKNTNKNEFVRGEKYQFSKLIAGIPVDSTEKEITGDNRLNVWRANKFIDGKTKSINLLSTDGVACMYSKYLARQRHHFMKHGMLHAFIINALGLPTGTTTKQLKGIDFLNYWRIRDFNRGKTKQIRLIPSANVAKAYSAVLVR